MHPTDQGTLAVTGIVKSFPGVKALKGVSFDCRAGEIHALVGENGAGKSTLMRVLAGAYKPDSGEIRIDGAPVWLNGPRSAAENGIAMVYQDTKLVPDLDAAQNVFLGREPGGVLVDYRAMRAETASILARLGETLDLDEPVGDKPLAERQIIELARALATGARFLILDEPTSALSPRETERLFAILRDLRAAGTSMIFISHRLPEVLSLCDRITVLKDGEIVGTISGKEASEESLVSMMVGRDLALTYPPRAAEPGDVVLEVSNLAIADKFHDVNLTIRAGEILGLGGIAGSGQQDIVRALFGILTASGTIKIDGKTIKSASPQAAIKNGIVYLPSDRRGEGMFLPHSIAENIVLPHISQWSHLGILDGRREKDIVDREVAALKIKTPSVRQPVELLSGGNQQKVAFARWLLASPRLCIFDEPTQGVDVQTKHEIYQIIRALSERGVAVIVVSSDLLELIGISDRIQVVADGRIVDEMAAQDASEERIIGSAVRSQHKTPAPADQESESQRLRITGNPRLKRRLRHYGPALLLLAITALVCAYASFATPYFFTPRNLGSLGIQIAPLVIVALGQFTVILLGGIDLSAGPNISLATTTASFLIIAEAPFGPVVGVLAVLLTGALVGALNGALIVKLRLPDLLATLASFSAISGLALTIRPAPGGLLDADFAAGLLIRVVNVPLVLVLGLVAVLAYEVLLVRGRLGMHLYATGSSADAAFVAGIRTERLRFWAYVFSGVMAALAGLIIAARIGSGDPQAGTNFTLLSVTAVVLGGVSVLGGRGSALGVLVAASLLMVIQNAMNHLQISAYWQYVLTGGLTLAAVAIYAGRIDLDPRRLFRRRSSQGSALT